MKREGAEDTLSNKLKSGGHNGKREGAENANNEQEFFASTGVIYVFLLKSKLRRFLFPIDD